MKKFLFGLVVGILLTSIIQVDGPAEGITSARPAAETAKLRPVVEKPAAPTKPAPAELVALPVPQDKATLTATPKTAAPATPTPARFVATETAAAPAIDTSQSRQMFVTGSGVNLREGPSVSAQIKGQVLKGQRVVLLDQQGGWAKILPAPDAASTVWMSAQYLATTAPVAAPAVKAAPKRSVSAPSTRDVTRARADIIAQSTRAYQGSCPCPYSRNRAGRRCGKSSAWSRPGGASPICYESDVSPARLASYFARKRGAVN